METINALKALVIKHDPHCDFLIETKSNEQKMQRLAMRLAFRLCIVVEARGLAGGITAHVERRARNTLFMEK